MHVPITERERSKQRLLQKNRMGSWFSSESKDESNMSSSSSSNKASEKDTLLTSWNVAAGATVILPLFMFMIARLVNRDGGDGGGDGEGWWGRWWGGNEGGGGEGEGWWRWGNGDPEGRASASLGFVYFWSLAVFAVLVWRGNRVLGNNKDTRALFAALVVFANLAFLCWILIAGLGERGGEEEGWLSRFPSAMVLTFLFWTIFGAVFATILFRKIRKNKSLFQSSGDYEKYEDEGGII